MYYNKDLVYDFSKVVGINATINTNQSLYLNLCGPVGYKCDKVDDAEEE